MVSDKDESVDPAQPASAPHGAEQPESYDAEHSESGRADSLPGESAGTPTGADADPAVADFGAPVADFGAPVSGFGPALNDFGPPTSDFGPATSEFGPPTSEFSPVFPDFGAASETSVPGWAPAPAPIDPDLGWRPADGAPIPAVPPEYRAPDSSIAPGEEWYTADTQYDNGAAEQSNEATVRHPLAEPPTSKPSSGWATGGGIRTAHAGRESAWLRNADSGIPPSALESPAPQQESLSWADDPIGKMLTPKKPAPQQESLSWADDPIAKRLTPKPVAPEREQSAPPWGRIAAIAGAAVAALVVIGLIIVAFTGGEGGDDEATRAAPLPAGSSGAPSTTAAKLSCSSTREGPLTIGNGEGGTGSGADAILGFQHAIYTERNGVKARTFVAPDTVNVSQAETIQSAGIDPTPIGTRYCLRIVELAPETYAVDLTEQRPDGKTTVYRQNVATVNQEGRNLIFAIYER